MEIDLARVLPVRLGWDEYVHPFRFGGRDDFVRVVAFVADEVLAARRFDELRRFDDVVDVAGREVDVGWITETVNESVDLGGEAAARASNTLILDPPFPPAECWCALA